MLMTSKVKRGIVFALITAVISGFSIFYNKLVLVKGIDPLIFNILKNGGVAVILSLLLLPLSQRKNLAKLSAKTWRRLLLIGLIGGSIPFILFFEGLKTASAVDANLIQKSLFIWVAAAAIPILGERLSLWQVAGYLIIAWSNLFIGGFTGFKINTGEMMILAATFFWTIEVIVAKITLRDVDNIIVSWGRMFLGSLILILVAGIWGKLPLLFQIKPDQLMAVSGSILLLTGYVTFWFKALKYAPATIVTAVLILATPITNILSAIFITHTFPQVQIVNLLGIIIGIILISLLLPKAKENSTVNSIRFTK